MYFIFPNLVLDIEVIVIPVYRIVTYGVQYIISSTYSRVQTRQPTRRSYARGNGVEDTGLGNRTYR